MTDNEYSLARAKEYQKKHQTISFIHLAMTPALFLLMLASGLSRSFVNAAEQMVSNRYAGLGIYLVFFSVFLALFDFPISFYSGYVLEQKFKLSNQTLAAWFGDFFKKTLLSFSLSLILMMGLYSLIWHFPTRWWIFAWAGFAGISYILGKLFPVVIVPLFYKYGKVEDESLKQRIFKLAERYNLPIENVYSLNLSKTTKKANAAFMGMGKTKRVVLSDTLLENFTADEIETVVAHELGHYKHKDIWKQLAFGLMTSFLAFWIAYRMLGPAAHHFGFSGAEDPGSLPLLFLIFFLVYFILTPLQNGFSRVIERAADRFALRAFPHPEIFISCMDKLGKVNLSDPYPNAFIEWMFYDHPAIGKRIEMAKNWKG